MTTSLTLGQGLTIGSGITIGAGSGGIPPGIFLNAGTYNPGDTMSWLFNKVLPNTKYYLWVEGHSYSNDSFTPAISDGVTSVTTDGNGDATFDLVLSDTQTGGTFNMYFAPTLYQGNGAGGVGFMGIIVNSSSGSGAGAGGGQVALNISGISMNSVPDSSGNNNTGILIGTYSTGSDSHGSYVYLNGGYIRIANYNVSAPFTVRIIAAIDSSQRYWASLWGNENYDNAKGYFAYLSNITSLTAGPVDDGGFYTVSGVTSISQWDFVITDSSVSVYKNGSSIGSAYSYSGSPSGGDATNDLYIGSRHTNAGTGSTDVCKMKVYAVNIFTSALSGSTIVSDYTTNQSTFSI